MLLKLILQHNFLWQVFLKGFINELHYKSHTND